MELHRTIDPLLPEESSGVIVPVMSLGAELVRTGISYWRQLAAGRVFPSQPSLVSCLSTGLADNSILVEVIDGGADYEYRMLGTEIARGFDADFTGRRLSDLIETAPKFGLGLRMLYEMVRASGEPLGYRGWMGNDVQGAGFVYHESVLLPLGEDGVVDHILTVGVLVLRQAETA